ncbi:MAG: hypothetical protein ACJZ76_03940 [Candidatus Pelagibacter sp.]
MKNQTIILTKILNLKSQASPVGTLAQGKSQKLVESDLGYYLPWLFDKTDTNGNKIIVAQIKIEPVTFSFFFLLIFKVKTPTNNITCGTQEELTDAEQKVTLIN